MSQRRGVEISLRSSRSGSWYAKDIFRSRKLPGGSIDLTEAGGWREDVWSGGCELRNIKLSTVGIYMPVMGIYMPVMETSI